MEENTVLQVSEDQEKNLVIAEKPLKEKEVVNKVWLYLIHHRRNPFCVFCRPNLQHHPQHYHLNSTRELSNTPPDVLRAAVNAWFHPHFCLNHNRKSFPNQFPVFLGKIVHHAWRHLFYSCCWLFWSTEKFAFIQKDGTPTVRELQSLLLLPIGRFDLSIGS